MPGQKISSMTLVSDLQDNDQFPIARNGSTFRISGRSLASRAQLLQLSAAIGNGGGEFQYSLSALGNLANLIPNPSQKNHSEVLTYDTRTETWVASALPNFLPRIAVHPYQILTFDYSTQTWVASAAPSGGSETTFAGDGAPVGGVMFFAASAAPAGWLECAGQEVHRQTFIDLWKVIGYTFGSNYDGTYFRLPDLRGESVRGWDHGRGVDPDRAFGSFQKGSVAGDTSRIVLSSGIPLLSAKNILGFDSDVGDQYKGLTLPPLSSANYNLVVVNEEEPTNLPSLSAVVGISRSRNVALMPCIKYAYYNGLTQVGISAQNIVQLVLSLSAYSLGTNQAWNDVTSQRLCNVVYTNTTLKPIQVQAYFYTESAPFAGECTATLSFSGINPVTVYGTRGQGGFSSNNISFVVPPFWSYKIRMDGDRLTQWTELR